MGKEISELTKMNIKDSKKIIGIVGEIGTLRLVKPLCHPMDCSPPGFSVNGISQARILEWVAISFSRRMLWGRKWKEGSLSSSPS